MPLYEPTVPTRYTVPLLQQLRARVPASIDAVLAMAAIDPSLIEDPEAALSIVQFDALVVAVTQATGRSDLGFELGRRITVDMHSTLGQAMRRCSTVDGLLLLASRYSRLMSPSFAMEYRRQPHRGELIWRPAAGMSTLTLHAFFELHAVSLYMQLHDVLGDRLGTYDVWLPMPKPRHAARYRELPKLVVHYGRQALPHVRTVFDSPILDQPFALPAAADAVPGTVELSRLQRGFDRATSWADWVRLMLREADSHQPTQAELASLLNLSAHTLARYLAGEGCSFRSLASGIRHQRACDLLSETSLGIAEIAHRLGYGDASNFSHAFRKLQGESAHRYRDRTAAKS